MIQQLQSRVQDLDFLSRTTVGVPKSRRGEIWQFLAVQYRLRHRLPNKQQPPDTSYKELLKQLTTQQHAILVDLGMFVLLIIIYKSLLSFFVCLFFGVEKEELLAYVEIPTLSFLEGSWFYT